VEGFTSIAQDIKRRLMDNPAASSAAPGIRIDPSNNGGGKSGCCQK